MMDFTVSKPYFYRTHNTFSSTDLVHEKRIVLPFVLLTTEGEGVDITVRAFVYLCGIPSLFF